MRHLLTLFALCTIFTLTACVHTENPTTQDANATSKEDSAQPLEPSEPTADEISHEIEIVETDPNAETIETAQPQVETTSSSTPPQPSDLLSKLRSSFTLNRQTDRPEVIEILESHKRNPDHYLEILTRGAPFLSLITAKIEERGMPLELALLPFVESGYEATSFSQSGAAGLWQIIPNTARHLDLEMGWWYDERLDILKSTDKALDYLSYLNDRFEGDWELTLAAYNGGESHVASRIRQASGNADFWAIELKRETTAYVPKLLAAAEVVANPDKYGVELPTIHADDQLIAISVDTQLDLRLSAKAVGLTYSEFKKLNSGYLRWISEPGETAQLLIPVSEQANLLASINDIATDQNVAWDHYRVKNGDTLSEIAREFGTTLRALIAVNDLDDSRIYKNQDLLIPKSSEVTMSDAGDSHTIKQLYIVESGDSLWEISRDHNVSIEEIRRLNSLRGNTLRIGKVLVLAENFTGSEITYEVKSGDSLSTIANRFRVAVSDIRAWNALDSDLIKLGQELTIRPGNS